MFLDEGYEFGDVVGVYAFGDDSGLGIAFG
jgi:hypothetical protein